MLPTSTQTSAVHLPAVRHHRVVVLCECFSLFIFTDSRRTLSERTVAKHLCAGTEERHVCCRLVMCTEKHAGLMQTNGGDHDKTQKHVNLVGAH